jgi:ATPase subunit of ABC transporter with duplicated ATPase domains
MVLPGLFTFKRKEIMLTLQHLSYIHPNQDLLFDNLNLTLNKHQKTALIGHNGTGKSTLLKLISGELQPYRGQVIAAADPYYIPQIFGQYNHLTIAQALRVEHKLNALKEILEGHMNENNLAVLNDDWTIEEKCREALDYWHLGALPLEQKIDSLSGGQKTKVFLAGISIHRPQLILLDEPSNHLDTMSRALLYHFIRITTSTLIVASHDRALLNELDTTLELSKHGITTYGGNYDFYATQKELANEALYQDLRNKEKTLKKAKEKERETLERQQKLDSRGKKKQEKAGVARIMLNTLRNNAEKSTSKTKHIHEERIGEISKDIHTLRKELPEIDKIKFGFENPVLHRGKRLFTGTHINYAYGKQVLWRQNLDLEIQSGERIALKGPNGSGKSTLIKLILGELKPSHGSIQSVDIQSVYIDQEYSLIDGQLSIYEQTQKFNTSALQEHEIKIRLNRFLFTKEDWSKPCTALSGGEKMRLLLCCLTIHNHMPDLIVLDEPTNNLDLQNIAILTTAINEYQGTLIVVSHDEYFLQQVNVERSIEL